MLFGFQRAVEHLDGSIIFVNQTTPAPPGTEIRVAGRGFRSFVDEPGDTWGDFVVRVNLAVPATDADERGAEKRGLFESMVDKI